MFRGNKRQEQMYEARHGGKKRAFRSRKRGKICTCSCYANTSKRVFVDVNCDFQKALFMLAASNAAKELKCLLAHGVRAVNVRDETGATALHWAVRCRSQDCVRELLKCPNIDLDVADAGKSRPTTYRSFL